MALRLFEYAVLYHPKSRNGSKAKEDETNTQIITKPTTILAKDEKVAGLIAARGIDAKYADKLDRVEIIVRPF